jgi:very-short-patch-repair endonuclease
MNHRDGVQRSIEALAATQFGAFGRRQALELGATARMIDRRLSGAWPIVLPRVYRVAAVPRSKQQNAMAAALWAGPDGLVSFKPAGELWGFEGIATDEVHVTADSTRRLHSRHVVVHRVSNLLPADVGRVGPIPVTSALRTAIDLAGVVEIDVLEVAIESPLRRRLFTVGQLRWRSDALLGTGRPGSASLRALLERRDLGAADSAWEVRTAQILIAAGFVAPTRQHVVRDQSGKEIARADLAYPESTLIIEYDSDQWHNGTQQRHRDATRRNTLRALGWTVIEVTSAQLRDPKHLLAAVALVLAA